MPNLIVLAGVPGSGKSTWAKSLFDLKYKIISSDDIRKELYGTLTEAHAGHTATHKPKNADVFDLFNRRIEDHLLHGVDVIADATFLTKRSREDIIALGWKHNAKVHLVFFKNVLDATTRNARRDEEHRVPEDVMDHFMKKYYDSLAEIVQEPWDSVLRIERYT